MNYKRLCIAFTSGFLALSSTHASTLYSNMVEWNGSGSISAFGAPPFGSSTIGQTFIAPNDNMLTSFGFQMVSDAPASLQFHAYVYAWSGDLQGLGKASGTPIFSSDIVTYTNSGGLYKPITINTGLTQLIAGDNYVAFLTISNPVDFIASTGIAGMGFVNDHGTNNGGGNAVWLNNNNDPSLLTTTLWSNHYNGDLAFQASFTVPEPSTYALFGIGAIGMIMVMRRKNI
jgi:hypothetical protein